MENKQTFYIESLGCDKNRIDSEIMAYKLVESGYTLSQKEDAQIIIVNSCGFIESARQESINKVIELSQYKNNLCKKIILTGCLPQIYGQELYKDLTEADCICGANYEDIVKVVDSCFNSTQRFICPISKLDTVSQGKRIVSTPSHYAYVKIADGCNNFCSYCSIPYIRGRFRSRPIKNIIDEVVDLVNGGVREVILVAQDTTKYGFDLYGKPSLVELLTQLTAIQNLHWIRILYCYPELVDDSLLKLITASNKIAKYIDIPLQHVDDFILAKMNRKTNEQQVYDLFDNLTANYPDIALRTTFICGFPYEDQTKFNKVATFLKKYKLDNVGFFAYSIEEGTPAAKFEQIDKRTKETRVKKLYQLQQKISCQNLHKYVGRQLEVVVEEKLDDCYIARSMYQAPDIDGIVYIYSDKELTIGQFYNANITQNTDYDLIGEIL
ncbi:MAG: 30S ribosomal protein S12 methylthiotransferase RimO [Clostridia bacterium]